MQQIKNKSYFNWIIIPTIICVLNIITFISAFYNFSISPFFIFYILIGLVFTPRVKVGQIGKIYLYFFFIFIISGTIPIFFKPLNTNIFYYYRAHIYSILLFYFVYNLTRVCILNNEFKKLFQLIIINLFIGSFSTILFYILEIDILNISSLNSGIYEYDEFATFERSGGLYVNPNFAGISSIYTISFSFVYVINFAKKSIFYYLFVLIGFISGIVTFSKTFILNSLLLTIITTFIFRLKYKFLTGKTKIKLNYTAVLFGVSLFVIISLIGTFRLSGNLTDEQINRLNILNNLTEKDNINNEDITTGRTILLGLALDQITSNPIAGLGLRSMFEIENSSKIIGNTYDQGVHNFFILIYGEGGLLSILIFLYFIFYFYKNSILFPNIIIQILMLTFMTCSLFFFNTSHNVLSEMYFSFFFAFIIATLDSTSDNKIFKE